MNLTLPTVSVTAGPTWATYLNAAFTTVDAHNHTSGSGVPITTAAININADLDFNSYSATGLTSIVVESQGASIATPLCYYSVAGNPVYNNSGASAGRLVNVSFPMVTGDVIYASSTTAFGRLAIGSSGQVLTVSGGIPAWASPGASLAISNNSDASFTASSSVDLYLCSRAGTQAVTLPVTTGGGKQFTFKKTSTAVTSIVTITRAGSDNIVDASGNVTSTTLNTVGEEIEMVDVAVGTWQIINRRIPSIWTAYTPTGQWSTNTTYTGFYRRVGDSMEGSVLVTVSGGAPDTATFDVSIAESASLTIDTSKQPGSATGVRQSYGACYAVDGGTATYLGVATYNGATKIAVAASQSGSGILFTQAIPFTFGNGDFVVVKYCVPITGWNG